MAVTAPQLLPTPTGAIYPRNPHFQSPATLSPYNERPHVKTFPLPPDHPFLERWSEAKNHLKAILESDLRWRSVDPLLRGISDESATVTILIAVEPGKGIVGWKYMSQVVYDAVGWDGLVVELVNASGKPGAQSVAESMQVPRGWEGPLVRGFVRGQKKVGAGLGYGRDIGALTAQVLETMWSDRRGRVRGVRTVGRREKRGEEVHVMRMVGPNKVFARERRFAEHTERVVR